MNSNNRLRKELHKMKKELSELSVKRTDIETVLSDKAKSDMIGSNLLTLFNHMMSEYRNIDRKINNIEGELKRINANLNTSEYYEQEDQEPYPQENRLAKVQPISELDAQILQIIQRSPRELACADDVKKHMNYRGRNAASARLNKLYKQGLLERYQLGHKVYYKFDAGKTTTTLIVSPPQ